MTRRLVLVLTFATGFSGLVYQVTWQRYLATLLGSHGEATAAVLGIFLGGLAVGYALFGGLARRRVASAREPRLLAIYGLVEAGIGAWALAFPSLHSFVRTISLRLPELPPAPAFATDVLLAALLLVPPTLLMGGTIPILTQALARSTEEATRIHARVYGINTAGAVLGALVAGFWMVSALGFPGTLRLMALINLGAGFWFWRAGNAIGTPPGFDDTAGVERIDGLPLYLVAALLSGFAMMTLEIVAIRIGGLALGSSEYSFAVVVAVFVGCIAAGSLVVGALPRVPGALLLGSQVALVAVLTALYSYVPLAPYAAQRIRALFTLEDADFYPYYALVFLGAALAMAPAVLLSGATLPLIFDHLRRRYGELGSAAGRLYSWNTVGSLLGALVGGYALLSWLDLHHVYRISVAALAIGAALLALGALRRGGRRLPIAAVWAVLAGLAIGLATLPAWPVEDLAAGLFRRRAPLGKGIEELRSENYGASRIIFYDDDPGVSVAVVDIRKPGLGKARALLVNGKSDSTTFRDLPTTISSGVIPTMLAESPRRAFVVGMGTGVTGGVLAELEGIEEVVVSEISPGVAAAGPLFDFASNDASRHPRIRVVRSDAYRALQRERGRFDVIVSEPSNPWVTGVEMLYSREFLASVRSRLARGGVFCQWMHLYETDDATVEMVVRTFSSVFGHVAIWHGLGPDLFVMGFAEAPTPETLLARVLERAALPAFAAALERAKIPGAVGVLSHELVPLGVLDRVDLPGPLHTLEHPRLAHLAARAFFRGQVGEPPFTGFGAASRAGREAALLPRYLRGLPDDRRREAWRSAVAGICRHRSASCTTFLAAWFSRGDDPAAFETALGEAIRTPSAYGQVDRADIAIAARLLPESRIDPLGPGEAEAGIPIGGLAAATRAYRAFYHHAFPFDPDRLLRMWGACRDAEGRCDRGRRDVEKLLSDGTPR